MSNKKRVFGIILIGIIALSVVMVSAGFWSDLFSFGEDSELEGELHAEFGAELTIGNNAPTLVSWTKPDEDNTLAGKYYAPTCGSTVAVEFSGVKEGVDVTVDDADGCADLADNGQVRIYFEKGGVYRPGPGATDFVTCTESSDPATCSGIHPTQVVFRCPVINMQFYDVISTNWVINVQINDGESGWSSTVSSTGGANDPYLEYGQGECIEFADTDDDDEDNPETADPSDNQDTIEFGSLTLASIDALAPVDLMVYNEGNVNYDATTTNYLQIKGNNLESVGASTDEIDEISFSVDETEACNVGQGITTTLANIPGASLGLDTDAGRNPRTLFFCAESVIPIPGPTLTADDYVSKSSPNNWEVGTLVP